VHTLLSSKTKSTALFLDFKSAFDVINYQRLDQKLQQKKCPRGLQILLQSLMFINLKSRVLINSQVTPWFTRSRRVLQGSLLSPWLFNLFIDNLLFKVNIGILETPLCFFYADNGVILPDLNTQLLEKAQVVED
jgi:hypothetical protein